MICGIRRLGFYNIQDSAIEKTDMLPAGSGPWADCELRD